MPFTISTLGSVEVNVDISDMARYEDSSAIWRPPGTAACLVWYKGGSASPFFMNHIHWVGV